MNGSTPQSDRQPTDREATRCVVLAPRDADLDETLRLRLRERGWRTMTVHDPHIAMAELCLQERIQASRSAWGLQRAERLALVIALPGSDAAGRVSMLLDAVRRYVPAANVWRYEDGTLQLSIAGTQPESSAGGGETTDPVLATVLSGSASSMHDAPPRGVPTDATAPDASDEDDPSRITADELAMLLGRDQDEAPPT